MNTDMGNVFDEPDLAYVDDLPVCCICGKKVTGLAGYISCNGKLGETLYHCEDAPNCRTGQGELGI